MSETDIPERFGRMPDELANQKTNRLARAGLPGDRYTVEFAFQTAHGWDVPAESYVQGVLLPWQWVEIDRDEIMDRFAASGEYPAVQDRENLNFVWVLLPGEVVDEPDSTVLFATDYTPLEEH